MLKTFLLGAGGLQCLLGMTSSVRALQPAKHENLGCETDQIEYIRVKLGL